MDLHWNEVIKEVKDNTAYDINREWVLEDLEALKDLLNFKDFKQTLKARSWLILLPILPFPPARRYLAAHGHVLRQVSMRPDFDIVGKRMLNKGEFESALDEIFVAYSLDLAVIENEFLRPKSMGKQADIYAKTDDVIVYIEVHHQNTPENLAHAEL